MNSNIVKFTIKTFTAIFTYLKDHPEETEALAETAKTVYSRVAKNAKKKQASATK